MATKQYVGMVQQLGDVFGRVLGVMDENAAVVACSDLALMNTTRVGLPMDSAQGDVLRHGGYTYRYADTAKRAEIIFVEGEDDIAGRFVAAAAIALESMLDVSAEKYDHANFVKNVVTDNIMPSDVYVRARELNFPLDAHTAALLIRTDAPGTVSVPDIVAELFPEKQRDFVFNVSETDTVLIKSIDPNIEPAALEKLAASIADVLQTTHYVHAEVGIGSIATGLKEMAASFKDAQLALEVGKVFDTAHTIVNYSNLGIARLIYQLPTTICQQFLSEVFKKGSIDSLDAETLFTIQRFFENNLNVSETSRGLFVHRNTLVYRLEKIKKLTGLDLREFDQAIVFKVALMVRKYLNSANETF